MVAPKREPENLARLTAPVGGGRQAIEGNPLMHDEIQMFVMFEQKGWALERRRAHILSICPKAPSQSRAKIHM